MKDAGVKYEIRTLEDDQEYEQELLKKVMEEAQGLSRVRSREEFLDEYADLAAVLNELITLQKFSKADVKLATEKNTKKKGNFKKRLFLHWSEDSGYKSNETPQGIKSS
jgi:predicted house-cleaning noncanonical NTP pyrophosphatase (MazG superfamily)